MYFIFVLVSPTNQPTNQPNAWSRIHLRNWDLTPTSEDWVSGVLTRVISIITSHPYPVEWGLDRSEDKEEVKIRVHVFGYQKPNFTLSGHPMSFYSTEEMPLSKAIHHFINADISIRTAR